MSFGSMGTDNSAVRRVRETKETEYNTNHKSISPEKVKPFFLMSDPILEPRSFRIFDDLFASKWTCCENPITFPQAPLATWRWGAAWQNVVTWSSSNSPNIVFMNFQTGFFGGSDWHQPKKLEKSFKEHMYIYIELYLGSCQCSTHCNTWQKLRLGFPS